MGKDLKGRDLGKGFSQRPDKRYEARAIVNGVKIDLYNTDLKQLKIDFEAAKAKLEKNLTQELLDITVNGWFDKWYEKYKKPALKPTSVYPTMSRYNSIFRDTIGDIKVVDLRGLHIQSVVSKECSSGRALSTIRSAISTLRDCLDSAVYNRIIDINPVLDVMLPWQENKKILRRYLSRRELELFLEQADTNYYKEMFYIMLCTGMRIGEIGGLQWNDIDFKKKIISINRALSCQYHKGVKTQRLTDPKTSNSFRDIPFMGDCEVMLKSWKEKQAQCKKELGDRWRAPKEMGNLVFTSSMGSPVTRYIVEKEINKMVVQINAKLVYEGESQIDKIYPHALRHTFCSTCFERGMSPKVVQQLMGHANFSTTMDIYTHVTKEKFSDDIQKFGNSLKDFPFEEEED